MKLHEALSLTTIRAPRALITLAIGPFSNAAALANAAHPLADVAVAGFLAKRAVACALAFDKIAFVEITVAESQLALPMLHVVHPVAFVALTVGPDMRAFALFSPVFDSPFE